MIMAKIETKEEIALIRQGGKMLNKILMQVAEIVRPGVSTFELDQMGEKLIRQAGGIPAFKNYGQPPYPGSVCTSINAEVVHGVPRKDRILKEGDIISLDVGMRYPAENGLYTDMAITVPVGKIGSELQKLVDVTRQALDIYKDNLRAGEKWSKVAGKVQKYVEGQGYGLVRDLVGHGVGHAVHEEPQLPNYVIPTYDFVLREGMVLACEPMVTSGDYEIETMEDHWTVATKDRKYSAHFEHTFAITKTGCEVLTGK